MQNETTLADDMQWKGMKCSVVFPFLKQAFQKAREQIEKTHRQVELCRREQENRVLQAQLKILGAIQSYFILTVYRQLVVEIPKFDQEQLAQVMQYDQLKRKAEFLDSCAKSAELYEDSEAESMKLQAKSALEAANIAAHTSQVAIELCTEFYGQLPLHEKSQPFYATFNCKNCTMVGSEGQGLKAKLCCFCLVLHCKFCFQKLTKGLEIGRQFCDTCAICCVCNTFKRSNNQI